MGSGAKAQLLRLRLSRRPLHWRTKAGALYRPSLGIIDAATQRGSLLRRKGLTQFLLCIMILFGSGRLTEASNIHNQQHFTTPHLNPFLSAHCNSRVCGLSQHSSRWRFDSFTVGRYSDDLWILGGSSFLLDVGCFCWARRRNSKSNAHPHPCHGREWEPKER